jgi:hypothetical protein
LLLRHFQNTSIIGVSDHAVLPAAGVHLGALRPIPLAQEFRDLAGVLPIRNSPPESAQLHAQTLMYSTHVEVPAQAS